MIPESYSLGVVWLRKDGQKRATKVDKMLQTKDKYNYFKLVRFSKKSLRCFESSALLWDIIKEPVLDC